MSDASLSGLVLCIAPAETGKIPDEIQFLPPGKHTVTAWRVDAKGDKAPAQVTVTVDEQTAKRLQDEVAGMLAQGREPYVDFNHDAGRAAGWVEGLRWGGDDPAAGGVRMKVRWTASGRAALEGRDYRMFSPAFRPADNGEIVGTAIRMGGLVNSPAFGQLKIVAANAATQQQERQMAEQTDAQALAAKETEIAELKRQMGVLKMAQAEQQKKHAQALVQAACAAGKLPAKATEIHSKWVMALCAYPDAAELLEGLPVREVPGRIIQASAEDRTDGVLMAEDKSELQRSEVAAYQAKHGVPFGIAWSCVKASRPELFS